MTHARLKQVCSLSGDYGLNIAANEYVEEGVPLIRTSDFDNLGHLNLKELKYVSRNAAREKMLRNGDILFSRSGTIGRCTTVDLDREATFAAYLVRFRPLRDRVAPRYIHWWTQSQPYWDQVGLETIESTIGNFNAAKFSNLRLPSIEHATQTVIANFLDRETTRIDQLIEKKKKLLDLADEKRSALITAAVTGRADTQGARSGLSSPHDRLRGGMIYSFPQTAWLHVRTTRLGLKSRIFSGGTPDKSRLEFWEDGELAWIGSGEVNQEVIITPTAYITQDAVQKSATKLFPAGSVAMALAGQGKTKATVAVMGIDAYGNQSLACIADYKGSSRFLFWWLSSLYKEIRGLSSQDTRDGLNQSMVGQIPVPDFPRDFQKKIADFLGRKTTEIDALKMKTRKSIDRLQELRAALITAAVTGQIDVATWRKQGSVEHKMDEIEQATYA